ncbi:hypothetical protein Sru01_21780 [Sphaerisporangium rufum]|uniref:Protein kinase domain-containing protein n=1 Tax=Sphaerisporangium rufum TaxID=1381558 RepID=A0A919QZW9_9ACTN|nr:serine/threonine-protein kinase [Sphaerisporangium rufum]GII77196.1 hypothetical protein Sru01_21780 [Sphaerisporangium rufum]
MARGGAGGAGRPPPGVRPLTVGDPVIIGRYLLLGRLGAGGMGVVYLAEAPGGGLVALKTPHAVHLRDPELRARFAEEVAFSRRVVPFCTAAVLEDGTDRDRPFLVTEHIPGPSLAQVVAASGPLTPDQAYGVAVGSMAALTAIHQAGFVHRDLKPGNVLLSPHGPRVIDFGIARDLSAPGGHTRAGHVMGSPGWMSPERLTGQAAIPASDVFAWGCLIAYAATGHHPFGTGEDDVLARRVLLEQPRLASVPKLLWGPVSAALAKEPAERPDAAAMLTWLLAAGGVDVSWDRREAVAAVLEEIWEPVPHPRPVPPRPGEPTGAGPAAGAPATVSRASRAERRTAARRAHASNAGFAALATLSIAALTVYAAGVGGRAAEPGAGRPVPVPVVVPADGAPSPVARSATPARRPVPYARTGGPARPAPATSRRAATPRTAVPPGDDGRLTASPRRPPAERPSATRSGSRPPRTEPPAEPTGCVNRRGRERPCPPSGTGARPTRTAKDRPTRTRAPGRDDPAAPAAPPGAPSGGAA